MSMFKKFQLVLFAMCLVMQADVAAMKRRSTTQLEEPASKKQKKAQLPLATNESLQKQSDHKKSDEFSVFYKGRKRYGYFTNDVNGKRKWKNRKNRCFKDKALEAALEAKYCSQEEQADTCVVEIPMDEETPPNDEINKLVDDNVGSGIKRCGYFDSFSTRTKVAAVVTIPLVTAVALYCLCPDVSNYVDACVGPVFGFLKGLFQSNTGNCT